MLFLNPNRFLALEDTPPSGGNGGVQRVANSSINFGSTGSPATVDILTGQFAPQINTQRI